jgi:hypothetical protein
MDHRSWATVIDKRDLGFQWSVPLAVAGGGGTTDAEHKPPKDSEIEPARHFASNDALRSPFTASYVISLSDGLSLSPSVAFLDIHSD